ncbi:hypothetical protein EGR_11114 [Echinococcus granulosus]|uniref:Uncharacterized protein n=1 Tax=Echinococcus granulosus TaxID=6210 RepID=W6U0R2_ECHGR|nr:hypothetical protein EGR_11114 [Echinococcus granulosus]EUB54031.1 hypothetical protein EGR_11114 [Echinococcus granulosus]
MILLVGCQTDVCTRSSVTTTDFPPTYILAITSTTASVRSQTSSSR